MMENERAITRVAEIARHLRSRPLPKDIEEDHQACLALSPTSAQRACLLLLYPCQTLKIMTEGNLNLPQRGALCLAAVLGRSRSTTSARARVTRLRYRLGKLTK